MALTVALLLFSGGGDSWDGRRTGSVNRTTLTWISDCVKHAALTLTRALVWFLLNVACCLVLIISWRDVTECVTVVQTL